MAPPDDQNQDSQTDNPMGGLVGGIMKLFSGGKDGSSGGMGIWGMVLAFIGMEMFGGWGGLLGGLLGGGGLSALFGQGKGDDDGQGQQGGLLGTLLRTFLGGAGQSQDAPDANAPNVARDRSGVQTVADTRTLTTDTDVSDRGNKTLAAGLTMASLVNFDKPVPATEIGANDQKKMADDFSRAGDFIKFYNDKTGQYEGLATNSPEALQNAIANDQSRRISIVVGSETKYFEQIAQANREESATGFTAAAWRETDAGGKPVLKENGKFDIWMGNPGYTGDLHLDRTSVIANRITDGTPQSVSMETISNPGGNVNPQAPEALAFANAVIDKVGADNIHGFVTGSQSMGQANMHAEYIMLKARNVQAQEITLDPIADTHQVAAIQAALANPNSALYQTLSSMGVSQDKIAELSRENFKGEDPVRVIFRGSDGHAQTTAEATLNIGKGLQQGIIDYSQGNSRAEGNGMAGSRQEFLDITKENLQNPLFDGHKLVNIFLGLEHGDAIYAAGQTMKSSNITVADASNATAQPGLPLGQPAIGRTPS